MVGVKGKSGKDNCKPTFSPKVQAEYRAKIDTNLIYKTLINHIKGETKMETTQVTAALGLLKKTLPDLAAMTISGDADNPFMIKDISDRPLDSKDWLQQQAIEGEVTDKVVN